MSEHELQEQDRRLLEIIGGQVIAALSDGEAIGMLRAAELRAADSVRLDWLERSASVVIPPDASSELWEVQDCECDTHGRGPTLRAAIDAAMQAEAGDMRVGRSPIHIERGGAGPHDGDMPLVCPGCGYDLDECICELEA